MNKTKFRSLTIGTLMLALAFVLSFAIGSLSFRERASAVEYRPSEIFSAGTNGTVGSSEAEENEKSFVEFTFGAAEGEIYFRRDLALKWYEKERFDEEADPEGTDEGTSDGEASALANPGVARYFSMKIAFPEIGFTKFTLSFDSAEENVSKESSATNALIFFSDENGLSAAVRNASEQPDKDAEEEDSWTPETKYPIAEADELAIRIDEENGAGYGEFAVYVNEEFVGLFTNIGGYFLEYLSSSSATPRDPITFRADELAEGKTEQKLIVKEINGQSFELNDNGRVEDNADPVLVVNEAIYAYTLGRKWSLTYEAIDVCDSSVTITRRYAMVNAPDSTNNYPRPTNQEYSALTTSVVFMPTSDDQEEEQYVSVYFELDDGRGLTDEEKEANRIYLTWYAVQDAVKTLGSAQVYQCPECDYKVNAKQYEELGNDWVCPNSDKEDHPSVSKSAFTLVEEEPFDYILVDRKTGTDSGYRGVYYKGIKYDYDSAANEYTNSYEEDAVLDTEDVDGDGDRDELLSAAEYQAEIDRQTVEYEEKDGEQVRTLKLSAGDGAYFYLPSLRGLIESDFADYRNLRFSIYYKKQSLEVGSSASSATSLRYNALRFEIDEEGKYIFRVLATDASGNGMYFGLDGQLVQLSSSNIWQIDEIPEFSFEVTYTGAKIEDPGEQSYGFQDQTYSISSFEIIALDGYESEYSLYYFDRTLLKQGQTEPTYSDFVKNTKQYMSDYADCFVPIRNYVSDVTEDDEDRWNRTDNKYHWNPDSSLSFLPQEVGYYVVELTVTEARLPGYSKTAYQVIDVRSKIDPLPDPISWLENNVTSVVLFSISAVLLIVIIILFVVKPSDKNVEEIDLEELKGKKKPKKN